MKAKSFFILAVLVCCMGVVLAQNNGQAKAAITGPEIEFDKSTLDFGTLNIGDVKVGTFTFTNVGKKPLILENVISNCDCTVLDWSRKPVLPGKKGTIKATYTAKNSGMINKWVTVMSNAETDRVILKLRGKVN